MSEKKKIVFLYTELAGYFLSCLRELMASGKADVLLFRYPVNAEAPFDFSFPEGIQVFDRKKLSNDQLLRTVRDFEPDLIYCSGWIDKGYLKVCKSYRKKIPVVVGMDNQWDGNFKQRLAGWLSFLLIKPYFNRAWVPGEPQKKFALQLGFPEQNIHTGFYTPDTHHFQQLFESTFPQKETSFPKRFIYVGRYMAFKGIFEMWEAFIELQEETPNEWELWCLGTGEKFDKKTEHPQIKHFGFVQPAEIEKFIAETGVFILPSTFEPWGVVVHEFAISGFPLLTTEKVGAGTAFLKDSENGFLLKSGNKDSIKAVMKRIMNSNASDLVKMARKSNEKGMQLTEKKWVETLLSFK